jgi:hypothetical protein
LLVLLAAALGPGAARSADGDSKVAVLVPANRTGQAISLAPLRDGLRSAIKQVLPSARPLAPESIEQLAQSNQIDLSKCEGLCEVDTGKILGVELLVSGEVTLRGDQLQLQLRLLEIPSGEELSEKSVDGPTVDALKGQLLVLAEDLFSPFGAHLVREGEDKAGPGQGLLVVRSDKPANVRIDSRPAGLTPLKRGLDPGVHFVDVQARGYKPYSKQVTLKAGETLTLAAAMEQQRGQVEFSVVPVDAALTLDDEPLKPGRTQVALGKHLVRVSREGYEVYEENILVIGGKTLPVKVALKRLPAQLLVTGPFGAACAVDRKLPQLVPSGEPLVLKVEPGERTLTCTQADHGVFTRTLQLAPGSSTAVKVDLVDLSAKGAGIRNGLIAGGVAVLAGGLAGYGYLSASGASSDIKAEGTPVDQALRQGRLGKIDTGNKLIVAGGAAAGVLALVSVYFFAWSY